MDSIDKKIWQDYIEQLKQKYDSYNDTYRSLGTVIGALIGMLIAQLSFGNFAFGISGMFIGQIIGTKIRKKKKHP